MRITETPGGVKIIVEKGVPPVVAPQRADNRAPRVPEVRKKKTALDHEEPEKRVTYEPGVIVTDRSKTQTLEPQLPQTYDASGKIVPPRNGR